MFPGLSARGAESQHWAGGLQSLGQYQREPSDPGLHSGEREQTRPLPPAEETQQRRHEVPDPQHGDHHQPGLNIQLQQPHPGPRPPHSRGGAEDQWSLDRIEGKPVGPTVVSMSRPCQSTEA